MAHEARVAAWEMQEACEAITLGIAWPEYVAERKPLWSDLHHRDHLRVMHLGGGKRARSKELTEPGTLASLVDVRLVDLTSDLLEQWAKLEAAKRPTYARLSLRLLKAFLFWCARHPTYKTIVTENAAQSKRARESLR